MEENLYWIWISKMKHITYEDFNTLICSYGSIENIWNLKDQELKKCKLKEQVIIDLLYSGYRKNLDTINEFNRKNNIEVINCYDRAYPTKLKKIMNRPILLYVKGNLNVTKGNCIRNSWFK